MKFAKALFTLSFLAALLLVPVFPAVSQQAIKPGQTTIIYGIPEDAYTYVPPPQIQRRPTQTPGASAAQSQFIVTYTGFTTQAQAAFQHAVSIWAAFIQTSVPIRINATFEDLGGSENGILLGYAGANLLRKIDGSDVWRVDALADAVTGSDLDPGAADINARFNSNSVVGWYYGVAGRSSCHDSPEKCGQF